MSEVNPTPAAEAVRPEPNYPAESGYWKTKERLFVHRVVMTNGNVQETQVFPGDYEVIPGGKKNKDGDTPLRPTKTKLPVQPKL